MGPFNDDGVGPKLIVGGGNHLNGECGPAFRNRRLRKSQYYTAIQEYVFERDHAKFPHDAAVPRRLYLSAH
jgi:hypothetical protein